MAKEGGPSLAAGLLPDRIGFSRGKKSFCELEMLELPADLLQIDPNFYSVSDRQQCTAMGVTETESQAAAPAFLVDHDRFATTACAKFQLDRVEANIPPQDITEKAMTDDIVATILLKSIPLRSVLFIDGKPSRASRLHVR